MGWLLEEARYIDIRGLQVGNQRVHRLEIDKLYTPLSTLRATLPDPTESRNKPRHAPASGALSGGAVGREPSSHRPGALQQALNNQRLVIVGDPGCGRTTFLRCITYAVCRPCTKGTLQRRDAHAAIALFHGWQGRNPSSRFARASQATPQMNVWLPGPSQDGPGEKPNTLRIRRS